MKYFEIGTDYLLHLGGNNEPVPYLCIDIINDEFAKMTSVRLGLEMQTHTVYPESAEESLNDCYWSIAP